MVQKPNDGHVHLHVSLRAVALAVAVAESRPAAAKPDGTCLSALHPRYPPAVDHFDMEQ